MGVKIHASVLSASRTKKDRYWKAEKKVIQPALRRCVPGQRDEQHHVPVRPRLPEISERQNPNPKQGKPKTHRIQELLMTTTNSWCNTTRETGAGEDGYVGV
ncbi:hypothetical protein CC1G_14062 [Coprinopsis cinerea okayama7|uniref:Uncharacterized protein n=1 Tax=Coprinopsis cinerea (strain Okayama-7 / 130 / ATCC MYA-4618 / FGSC 9003) TaxID=240176 RepID=D6RL35_COPC7|nr:hypothetical protein CC1G_14062 [Coprinopsis cinerea okayama7\|eukprot:XP_002911530.1 hypothetical protein CC1G_14062 [Coprinopsis cinerea okayama7\